MTATSEQDLDAVEPLGPDSLHWQFVGDWRALPFTGRALVLQTAHPVVGAGVGQHSVYRTDPYGRLKRTTASVLAQVYGGQAAAAEGARLRALHRDINGVDEQGRRYSALNPEAYYWVHATGFEAAVRFYEHFDTPLDEAGTAQLFDEWRRLGRLLGIKDKDLPATQEQFWERWDAIVATLESNQVVQDLLYNPFRAPKLVPSFLVDPLLRRVFRTRRQVIAWSTPAELLERWGLPELTEAERARVERLARSMRRAGRLPDALRLLPVTRRARRRALKELRRAG